eukprot:903882-Rhodomonas_salina.1
MEKHTANLEQGEVPGLGRGGFLEHTDPTGECELDHFMVSGRWSWMCPSLCAKVGEIWNPDIVWYQQFG